MAASLRSRGMIPVLPMPASGPPNPRLTPRGTGGLMASEKAAKTLPPREPRPLANTSRNASKIRRKHPMRKILAAAVLAAISASLMSAAPAQAQTPIKIMVGGIDKQIYLPAKLAAQLGFFREQGLDVELFNSTSGSQAAASVLAREVQGVVGFCDHTIDLQSKGKFITDVVQFGVAPGEVVLVKSADAEKLKDGGHAQARGAGADLHQQSAGALDGRAVLLARRADPRIDAGGAVAIMGAGEVRGAVRHPRSRRGDPARRPGCGADHAPGTGEVGAHHRPAPPPRRRQAALRRKIHRDCAKHFRRSARGSAARAGGALADDDRRNEECASISSSS